MDGGEVDVPLLVSELRVLQYTNYLQNYTPAKRRCPLFVYNPYSMVHAIPSLRTSTQAHATRYDYQLAGYFSCLSTLLNRQF